MSDNVKTVEQFLETARMETGDVWMDNHDWIHLIEMVEQLTQERDAARAALAEVVEQRGWQSKELSRMVKTQDALVSEIGTIRADLAAARTTLAIVQEREIKLSLTLGHVYLALTRLAAEPQTDTAAIIEMMTMIEAVVPGDGNGSA